MPREYNKHHRRPKSKNGGNSNENVVVVPIVQHEAFHTLFGTEHPKEIARILTEIWIDPEWILIAVRKT